MGALSLLLRNSEGGGIHFWCPGCDEAHMIRVRDDGIGDNSHWSYNLDPVKPTFRASILVRGHDFTDKGRADYEAYYSIPEDQRELHPPGFRYDSYETVCHSFVTDGRIEFLSDCTHKLAGQTVDLPTFPGNEEELK